MGRGGVSRPLRIEYPGAFYHVTSRGNERGTIFQNNRDREKMQERNCVSVCTGNPGFRIKSGMTNKVKRLLAALVLLNKSAERMGSVPSSPSISPSMGEVESKGTVMKD